MRSVRCTGHPVSVTAVGALPPSMVCRDVGWLLRSTRQYHLPCAIFCAQAIGRVRRFPQQREVCVHRFFVAGPIEEEMLVAQGIV